jgi:hypothetical protein
MNSEATDAFFFLKILPPNPKSNLISIMYAHVGDVEARWNPS